VEETMMTLGSVRLPADDADVRARALADMRAAMVRNIAGVETSAAQGSVALLDSSGREQARVPATQIVARGAIAGKTVSMRARFFASVGVSCWKATRPKVVSTKILEMALQLQALNITCPCSLKKQLPFSITSAHPPSWCCMAS